MLIGDLIDTVLNLATFAFIGAMVWIYARAPKNPSNDSEN